MKRMVSNGIWMVLGLTLAAAAQNQPSSGSQAQSDSLADYARQVRKDPGSHGKPKVFDNDNLPKTDKLSVIGSTETSAPDDSTTKSDEAAAPASSSEAKPETKAEAKASENHSSPESKPKPAAGGENKTEPKSEGQTDVKAEAKAESKSTEEKPAKHAPTTEEDAAAKQAAWKQWGEKITSQKQQIELAERELNVLQREYQIRAAAMYADAGNRLRNQADWDKQDTQYKQQIADKQQALDNAKQKLEDLEEEARKAGVPASIREQ